MAVKSLRALGEMVVIRFDPIPMQNKVTKAGIEIVGSADGQVSYDIVIDTIGTDVKDDCGFKVGDCVVVNQHDVMKMDVENPDDIMTPITKGITRASSVWAVYDA